jgi:hypothetical protein
MQHFTMLVTPDGEWVSPDTPEFLAALGDPDPDYDAAAFAVKNLGFIKFQVIQHSIVEIELHPRNVELPALLAVQQQLLSSEMHLFRIKYFDTSWQSEISSTAEATISRLSELCTPAFAPVPAEAFISEPQDISRVFDDEMHPFRPLAQKWRVSFGNFDPSVISIAMRHQLLPRLAVVGVKPRERDPVFRFIGHGHKWVGRNYHVAAVNEKVADQPDKEYGEWVSEFYKFVATSNQPRYDLVTAGLRYEDELGKPRRTVRYERLLLPWRTPSDEVFVTLCSAIIGKAAPLNPVAFPGNSSFSMKLANSA